MANSYWFFRKAAVISLIGIALGGLSPAALAYSVWYNAEVLVQAYGTGQDRTISFSGCTYPTCLSAVYLPQTSITAPQFSASITGIVSGPGVNWTQQAGATWDGTATLGSLSGSSSSNASVSPATTIYNSTTYNNPYSATGQSAPATTGGIGWSDTAMIVSDTLAAGTGVDLRFTLRMDSQIDLAGAPVVCLDSGNRAFADSRFTLGNPGAIALSMKHDTCAYGWSNSAAALVTTGLGSSSNEISRIYHTTVGQAVPIGGWLSTYSKTVATSAKPDMTALANANSYFYVDVVTPGVSYTTASGASYSSPVPLPGAVWLLAGGLAGLAGFARRNPRR